MAGDLKVGCEATQFLLHRHKVGTGRARCDKLICAFKIGVAEKGEDRADLATKVGLEESLGGGRRHVWAKLDASCGHHHTHRQDIH